MIRDPQIDAIVIATPVSSHYHLAMDALAAGKHVLVEKPMALNSAQAERLVDEADRVGLDAAGGPHLRLHARGSQDARAGGQR